MGFGRFVMRAPATGSGYGGIILGKRPDPPTEHGGFRNVPRLLASAFAMVWAADRRRAIETYVLQVVLGVATGIQLLITRNLIAAVLDPRVTRDPSRAKNCANAQPIGPPPSTAMLFGARVISSTSALLIAGTSANPSIRGNTVFAPVAITNRSAAMRRSPTTTASGATNRASPRASGYDASSCARSAAK